MSYTDLHADTHLDSRQLHRTHAPARGARSNVTPKSDMVNIFSVDVEDYFHPSELGGNVSSWTRYPSRVDVGVDFLLEALASREVRATFFILGWVAARHASLVRRISEAGHEIGCHSYSHRLVYDLTPTQFQEDTRQAVQAIADATGVIPRVYRAPSYSITRKNLWALEVLASCGFTHDSSIYPIVHDRYGIPGFPRHACSINTASGAIVEVPIATVQLGRRQVAPVGGGAYMRLFPYRYMAAGIRRINQRERVPACVYLHPWELDPWQPRLASNVISRLRTYTGLRGMRRKLARLFDDFRFTTLGAVHPCTSAEAKLEAAVLGDPARMHRSPLCWRGHDLSLEKGLLSVEHGIQL